MTQGDKKQTMTFTLDPSVIAWLRAEAEKLERSMSYLVNRVLKDRIEQEDDSGDRQ